jgi:phage minor structural protein
MKYNIKIYDTNMRELARLENAYDISYELTLNALWSCSFTMPNDDPKIKHCKPYNFVELFDGGERVELFRIMPSTFTKTDKSYTVFDCEHVLATLLDDVLFRYHQIGNLGVYTDKVIRYVLDRQTTKRWQLTECDFKRQFEYKWENENLLAALFSIANPFVDDYAWRFNTKSYPWGLSLKKMDADYKADIQYKKNMQGIEKEEDPTNLVTRLYALGYGEGDNQLDISKVNGGKPYLEKNVSTYGLKSSILVDRRFESEETLKAFAQKTLDELSQPFLSYKIKTVDLAVKDSKKYARFVPGDYVRIRDTESGISLNAPIVKVSKRDVRGNPFDIELEVANKSRDVTGSISDLQNRTRISETYSQGATNLQQIAFADNAETSYPLELKFYIPQEMVRINKLILNYTIENFRSYSRGAKAAGYVSTSTSSGGGIYRTETTTYNGYQSASKTTGVDHYIQGEGGHNHGIPPIIHLARWDRGAVGDAGKWVESGNHTHTVDFTIDSHSHEIQLNVSDHDHKIHIDPHSHDPIHGIYEGGRANQCYLRVDGKNVYNYSKEVNLVPHLSKDGSGRIERGAWHTVEIVPDALTRINANIFIQLFTNSRGGGDY